MTLKDIITMVSRRWDDLGSEAVYNAVNEVIAEMNLRLEGIRTSEICVILENEIVAEFAGVAGLPEGADDTKYYYCHTTGGGFTAKNLYLGDGTEIAVSGLTTADLYHCSAALTTAGFAAGDVIYYAAAKWNENGYTWLDNRLTLKSGIITVIGIWIDGTKWDNRSMKSFDNDNDWEEYYEESRNVLLFNDYIGAAGSMQIIYKAGIAELEANPSVATEIEVPSAWSSVFMDGVISRLSIWDKTDGDVFAVYSKKYEAGLNRIEEYESNRLPYGFMRKTPAGGLV